MNEMLRSRNIKKKLNWYDDVENIFRKSKVVCVCVCFKYQRIINDDILTKINVQQRNAMRKNCFKCSYVKYFIIFSLNTDAIHVRTKRIPLRFANVVKHILYILNYIPYRYIYRNVLMSSTSFSHTTAP